MMGELKSELQHYRLKANRLEEALKFKSMEAEDYLSTLIRNEDYIKNFNDLTKELRWTIEDKDETIKKKDGTIRGRDTEIDRLKEALQGAQDIIEENKAKIEELELQIIEGQPTPVEVVEKEEIPKEDQEVQTEIAMEYFDRVPESRGSKNSKSQGQIDKSSMNEEQKEAMLNQNSSTAMGTNHHASLQIDIDGGLAHNQSLDMAQNSPGMKSKRSGVKDTIPEEEPDSGAHSRFTKKSKGIISN